MFLDFLIFTFLEQGKGQMHIFYKTLKAHCFFKLGKILEVQDALQEVRAMKPTDYFTVKYLAILYTEMGQFSDATIVLE